MGKYINRIIEKNSKMFKNCWSVNIIEPKFCGKTHTSEKLSNSSFYFKDKKDFEIDAILETNDGKWAAIEIKLGKGYIDEAAKNLLKLKEKTDKNNPTAFLAVVTTYEFAYQRDDGVLVIPIQCLKN